MVKSHCAKWLSALLILVLLCPALSWAQPPLDSQQDDLLKEMEEATPTPPPAAKTDKASPADVPDKPITILSKLVDNFHGSLRLRGMHFWQNPPEREGADDRNDFGNTLLKFTDKTGYKNLNLNIGAWVEYGNEENTYSGTSFSEFWQDMDRRRRIFYVNDLYLNYSGDTFNFLIGKKTLTNGMSTLYLPSDRMRPQDLNDPMDVKDLNVWQGKLDWDVAESSTVTLAFLPIYQPQKQPSETSRWMGERKQ
ncbi:MAG: hypothetical protein KBG09_08365, partial [Syntrophobacterales bacterium]|nr:hypothetical protein [Syntrophobacterales bacterium]